jgi:hypothetical protein
MKLFKFSLVGLLASLTVLSSVVLAECTKSYVSNVQSNIRKAEKALEQADRKIERLEIQRVAARDSMEQRINNIEYRRTSAYSNLNTLSSLINGAGALINCIFDPSQCQQEAQRIQNLISTVNRTIVKYEQQLTNLRDRRDRNDDLYVTRIENVQSLKANKLTQVTTLNNSLNSCKELKVLNPAENAVVQSPVLVKSKVIAGILAPLGDDRPGRVVLGIVVDGAAVATGTQFPLNQSGFIILDQGQAQTSITLAAGQHTLTVQVLDTLGTVRADFNSITRTITVN